MKSKNTAMIGVDEYMSKSIQNPKKKLMKNICEL